MILRELLTFVANILRFEEYDEEEKFPTICRGWCDCCCEHRIIIIIVVVVFVAFPSDFFKSFARRYMHTHEKLLKRKKACFVRADTKRCFNCATRNVLSFSLSLSFSQTLPPRVVVGALFVECALSSLVFENR